MNKFILLAFISSVIFSSCDYVDMPTPIKSSNDTAGCPIPQFPVVTNHIKKILIEDYTGHTCPNCPLAAKEMHRIDTTYPGRIVELGLHVSSFASPESGSYNGSPAGAFGADYRTSVGNTYDAFFGGSSVGLPQGLINRKDYPSDHLKFFPNWYSYVATKINEPSIVDLQIAVDFDQNSRKICCAIKETFLNPSSINDTLKLVVLLAQDSIIDYQKKSSVNVPNYVHQFVLRDAITPSGAWGEPLVSGVINPGTTHIKTYAYTIPASYKNVPCNVNHCHLIAFIYKARTYEIIQVEEIKLIE